MRIVPAFAIPAMVLAMTAQAHAEEAKPDPRAALETAIPEAIRMLEAKEHLAFIKAFVPPEELKKAAAEEGSIEDFAKKFGSSNKVSRLLAVLQSVKDAKPVLEDDGKKATYALKGEGKKRIVFAKIDGLWYIRN